MIDQNVVSTIRVGELPTEVLSLASKFPHEVGTELKKTTLEDLSVFIAAYIGASGGVGFRAISVTDGQTLPTTTTEEFILVGKGTYYNVSGGSTIVLTEELNALVSNGAYWFVGVEIPVNVELAGITQFIRAGFTNTTPSEDAVKTALDLKANLSDINVFYYTDAIITIAGTQDFTIPDGTKAFLVMVNDANIPKTTSNNATRVARWSQSGNIVTLTKPTVVNNYVYIISK